MSKLTELVIATGNEGKLAEFENLLLPLGISVFSKRDYPHLPDPEENGSTLEENALIKAKATFEHTGKIALADDTGLEVDALNGKPGIHSARYSDPDATPEKNIVKLLAEMATQTRRTARFRTVLVLYPFEGGHLTFQGVCEGQIIGKRRGNEGFGYDPVFMPDGYQETFAEMSKSLKNEISHRGKAIQEFSKWLNG